MNNRYRSLIPNSITMGSLACGALSLLYSANGDVRFAGMLILASYLLDLFDGLVARWLKAGSAFGLQLDSLSDIVSLGAAPGVLVFAYLRGQGESAWWVWVVAILVPLAGAFRLARYNLLPSQPTASHHTLGLTISTGGATLTLAVLSDLTTTGEHLPGWSFAVLVCLVCLLMVSRIIFPSFAGIISQQRRSLVLALLFAISLLLVPPFRAWLYWAGAYLVFSLTLAGYRRIKGL
ncbi:MAG: CDP-alcohol phosphatidyltransferase family protein [Anaerolineales bacterium]|nr:MAG: CDP-alcohol phosphatidyltransferase family protein [Anaerolineales bacterium]